MITLFSFGTSLKKVTKKFVSLAKKKYAKS